MDSSRTLQDPNGERWVIDTLEELGDNKSLTQADLKKIVADVIAEYSSGSIDLTMLVGVIASVKCYELEFAPDFKNVVDKLSIITATTDKNEVYNILIEALLELVKE